MKPATRFVLTLISLSLVAVGCKEPAEATASNAKATSQQMDKLTKDTKTATQEMRDYAYTQKTEFIATMRTQSAELHKGLEELAAKVEKAGDKAKAEAQPKLQALREQTARLDQQIDAAEHATEPAWNEVKNASGGVMPR